MDEDEEYPVTVTMVDVAKTETTRQFIILIFSVAGTVAAIYVQRKLSDPDVFSTYKMWFAWRAKRWADRQADRFTRLATHMANVYNGEKL
jgi:hypothetical protein